ncbi:MAG: glycoside hydrolase family 15 protein [bacterium]|nr:glycoside hydrolase family 15 protein [bacterium]
MAQRIERYAMVGDMRTAALIGTDGSVDWLCLPRFDSAACFAALLGGGKHGRWRIAPKGRATRVRRRYRDGSLVLETTFETASGVVRLTDCMPLGDDWPGLVRLVEGVSGRVEMTMQMIVRFDYGSVVPWVRRDGDSLTAIAGPDGLALRSDVEVRGKGLTTVAEFRLSAGDRAAFDLRYFPSHEAPPRKRDTRRAIRETDAWWRGWSARCTYDGPHREIVRRSLITLKALTYGATGGIVAAPTTSLPERIGGQRNWDYRFCWLRDATFTLYALQNGGFTDAARQWRDWLMRAVAGDPADLQIMYGVGGERRLEEYEVDWLPGYERSRPVRIGNAASAQFQLDVYGEVVDAIHFSRRSGIGDQEQSWSFLRQVVEFVEDAWHEPDEGIWEVRGGARHFTHSKIMAWVAIDRAVKAIEEHGFRGPLARWRRLRREIHDQVCRRGYDRRRNTFVQSYGSQALDASLLMIPLVGFLPPDDRRVIGTVEAIERELMRDGFVMRYDTQGGIGADGLAGGEGAFLACTFWLADDLALIGRHADARKLFDRLIGLCNDVGLLPEEFDPRRRRFTGNFPQAFSHVGLVNTAHNLYAAAGPAQHRGGRAPLT